MNKTALSPLTKKANTILVNELATAKISKAYKRSFNYDASKFFQGINKIDQYKCNDTGYLFFEPDIKGDSDFYGYFQQFDWYYDPWKWEHQQVVPILKAGYSLLEIGSGRGDFINKISSYGIHAIGLELNQKAGEEARGKGLSVLNISLEEFKKTHKAEFDIVCSFQVLEHISNVHSFISDSLECLKVGGYMIISVPNNNSFINEDFNPLNYPPHHIGWWNEESLSKLCTVFNIELLDILYEPLQPYHKEWYKTIFVKQFIKNKYLRKLITLLFKSKIEKITNKFSEWAIGHTVLGIYRKL